MLILNIEGSPHVQAVALDDPSPGYAAKYASAVRRYLPGDAVLRWVEVDVTTVAEYGPNEIAAMLTGHEEFAPDLPQTWETLAAGTVDRPQP